MSAICGILRESFDDYLADALPAPQRRILREHLAACEACRAAASSKDGSLLFARPLAEPVEAAQAASILAAVRTGVAQIETERRVAGVRRGGRRAAVAAASAAAALLALTVAGGSARRAAPVATAAAPPARTAPTAAPAAAAGLEPAALPAETPDAPSTATVYDLNPGASREEPRVVWIVDRGLDI